MEISSLVMVLCIVLGGATRAIVPWLLKLYQKEAGWSDWEWGYLRGQLIAVLLFVLAMPVLVQNLPDIIGSNDWYTAWLTGYASADIGRLVDKLRGR